MATLKPYIVTFNCGREPINPTIFASHLFSALPKPQTAPDTLVLCLQELAPLANSFLGGSYLVPYLSPFRHAVTTAAASLDNAEYVNIISRNIGMTAIMIFVLRDQTAQIRWLETAGVGVGMHEMGNKGAVGIRMGYSIGDSTLEITFVSAHLAPMEDALQRRNQDWANIVRGMVFTSVSPTAVRKTTTQRLPHEPSSETDPLLPSSPETDSIPPMSGLYTPTSHLFFSGDLNYRTSSHPPSPSAYLTWPQPTKDHNAPQHYSHLLPSDQLTRERHANRTLHGLQEAPINFPPTYKYSDQARSLANKKPLNNDTNSNDNDDDDDTWLWAKHRFPSWCDRILYLPLPSWMPPSASPISFHKYTALPLLPSSDHRPVACSFSIPATSIPEPSLSSSSSSSDEAQVEDNEGEANATDDDIRLTPPFKLDPRWKSRRDIARMKEVLVGLLCYLGLTWEGRGALFAVVVGAVGGWVVVWSLLQW